MSEEWGEERVGFEIALGALKLGHKVRRESWTDPDYLVMEKFDGNCHPCLLARKEGSPGRIWQPRNSDLFVEDWYVYCP
ncbi:hypothetical protein SCBWM1_gp144 [Synechococcus phage S-CBWM1]|uniref:Thoeris anti-defense 2-like domain-containing protein n=1 Tax=Synechococcus phage S-CBWM1 TaxID=2053653 RepID=A0A3G1L3S4_9CAUD|nr:hypothetical protein HOU61_gp053 [Synechococcus phage S-CBWM1]ATW62828.1 hypothetical protein SCBWM1_gp144 [Synechococcus phage S-CBWM1]